MLSFNKVLVVMLDFDVNKTFNVCRLHTWRKSEESGNLIYMPSVSGIVFVFLFHYQVLGGFNTLGKIHSLEFLQFYSFFSFKQWCKIMKLCQTMSPLFAQKYSISILMVWMVWSKSLLTSFASVNGGPSDISLLVCSEWRFTVSMMKVNGTTRAPVMCLLSI